MDSEICNVKFEKNFHVYQSTVNLGLFQHQQQIQRSLLSHCTMSPLVFTHFNVFLKQDKTNFQNRPYDCERRFSFVCVKKDINCAFWDARICTFSLQDPQHSWKATKLFFAETRCFYMRKYCMCCLRGRHFYKSVFRFHSLLVHFIICIFLLYRLNIFCVSAHYSLLTPVKSAEAPAADNEMN